MATLTSNASRLPHAAAPPRSRSPSPRLSHSAPNVIDLTTSSPPPLPPPPPHARFPHLSFPSTDAHAVPGPGPSSSSSSSRPALVLSDDDDDEDDLVIVSERRVAPGVPAPLPRRYPVRSTTGGGRGRRPASPPPFIVPPNYPATTSTTGRRGGGGGNGGNSDAALAARLAAEELARGPNRDDARVTRSSAASSRGGGGYGGYLYHRAGGGGGGAGSSGNEVVDPLDQLLAMGPPAYFGAGGGGGGGGAATGVRGRGMDFVNALFGGAAAPRGGGGAGEGGLLSGSGDANGIASAQNFLDRFPFLGGYGGLQGLYGYGGGVGGGGGGALGIGGSNAAGGWGGAAKVKAAQKKYAVRMSHPEPVPSGFSRDVVEPLELDENHGWLDRSRTTTQEGCSAAAAAKGKDKADVVIQELEPVCASCLDPLQLGSEDKDGKVWALQCGHVVCGKCLRQAKDRRRDAIEREKGGWVLDVDPRLYDSLDRLAKSPKKARNKRRVISVDGDDDNDRRRESMNLDRHDHDDGEEDLYAPPSESGLSRPSPSKKLKGKGKAKGKTKAKRPDAGVDANWTTCPVSTCLAKDHDILAETVWSRPFELYA